MSQDLFDMKVRIATLEKLVDKLDMHAQWAYGFESLFLRFGGHSWELSCDGILSNFKCSKCGATMSFGDCGPFSYSYCTATCKGEPCEPH